MVCSFQVEVFGGMEGSEPSSSLEEGRMRTGVERGVFRIQYGADWSKFIDKKTQEVRVKTQMSKR